MSGELSRREFLRLVGAAVPATALLGACGHSQVNARQPDALVYLSHDEAAFVDAATARLIPADALGPGANEAGVTHFIDLQLAGPFGRADRWYMQGPWPTGVPEQGFQSKLTPAQIYRQAIADTDAHCRQQYGQPFARLKPEQQDDVLHALEDGKLELAGTSAKTFFKLLWQNTQEGFLADPAYGGNQDFAGWKLIGFPGPRYNYVDEIEKFGERYPHPFVSLIGRAPTAAIKGAA